MSKIKVLFVCMGNICRSPTAEGVFAKIVADAQLGDLIETDSAGTHAYHVGDAPDPRARKSAQARGVDIGNLRARKAVSGDFSAFNYVLAMDDDNYGILENICPEGMESRLQLFLDYAPDLGIREVPDPYYGGSNGFERVLDMVEAASSGLLAAIREKHNL